MVVLKNLLNGVLLSFLEFYKCLLVFYVFTSKNSKDFENFYTEFLTNFHQMVSGGAPLCRTMY